MSEDAQTITKELHPVPFYPHSYDIVIIISVEKYTKTRENDSVSFVLFCLRSLIMSFWIEVNCVTNIVVSAVRCVVLQ